jgi:hypothetical protein
MSHARIAIVLIVGCFSVIRAHAQRGACQERTFPVSLVTKDASTAPELSTTNLEGTYRNQPVHVKLVTLEQNAPRIILLMDTSGSMTEKLNQSLDIAEDLLSSMPPAVDVGLAFFAKDLQPVARPTSDRQKLKYQLEGLRRNLSSYRGKTALWTAVLESVKMLGDARLGDSIYVISDGGDNLSSSAKEPVAIALTRAGIRMFAAAFPAGGQLLPSPEETVGRNDLQQVSEDTGGAGFIFSGMYLGHFPSSQRPNVRDKSGQRTQFGLRLDEQIRQLVSFYRVNVELPETVDRPHEWKLALAGLSKSQRDNLVLMYPHLLAPCN